MLDQIRKLETLALQLEPEPEQRSDWDQKIGNFADSFLSHLSERPVYRAPETAKNQDVEMEFEEKGTSLEALLNMVESDLIGSGIDPASNRHFGYIPGGGVYPAAMGDYISAVSNRYAGIFYASPGGVRMENRLIRWVADLVGYPETAAGNHTSGGSYATLIAIATAREAKKLRARDFERCVVYLTAQTHHAVHKALQAVGMKEAVVREIQMDAGFRMRPEALAARVEADLAGGLIPFLLVGSAGTTDAGAIDPLAALAEVAAQYDVWYHIDAAYGGFFLLCEELKDRFRGIERSDSLVIDPHKGLFLPYGSGMVLVREAKHLFAANSYQANYMQDSYAQSDEFSPADLSPELSKHFRGMRMWLPLKLLGVAPFRAALSEKYLLAQYAYRELSQFPHIEMGHKPELSVVLFRFIPENENPDFFNQQLALNIQHEGRIFFSTTRIEGKFFSPVGHLRFSDTFGRGGSGVSGYSKALFSDDQNLNAWHLSESLNVLSALIGENLPQDPTT